MEDFDSSPGPGLNWKSSFRFIARSINLSISQSHSPPGSSDGPISISFCSFWSQSSSKDRWGRPGTFEASDVEAPWTKLFLDWTRLSGLARICENETKDFVEQDNQTQPSCQGQKKYDTTRIKPSCCAGRNELKRTSQTVKQSNNLSLST